MARLSVDVTAVHSALAALAGRGLYLSLKALLALVALVALSPPLGGLILVVLPFFALSYAAGRQRTRRTSAEVQRLVGQSNVLEQEYLSAHALVKAFGLEGRAMASYRASLGELARASLRLTVSGALVEAGANLGTAVGQLLVLGVGGYLVMTNQLSVGTLLASTALLAAVFAPIASLASVGQTIQRAAGALDRLVELLDEPVTVADRPNARVLPSIQNSIELEGVTFGYELARPILRELNLTIPAGSHVAVVGASGCGKTTLANLLPRFWDPQQGRVLIDGYDVRDVTLESLRAQIGIVFQDTFVFDATVRENIALGRPGATDAEVRVAADSARLGTYIDSLPAGYDTLLGERGVKMSGGQRQRLALARVLLRQPRVLILDEATSALDTRTERELLEALDALPPGSTRISITHRLALAAKADWIVVLDNGRVAEQGTHADLIAAGGLYERLHDEQIRRSAAPSLRGAGRGRLRAASDRRARVRGGRASPRLGLSLGQRAPQLVQR
jgi:ABC-type multidrug transport system fused ATPase/permease subunit